MGRPQFGSARKPAYLGDKNQYTARLKLRQEHYGSSKKGKGN